MFPSVITNRMSDSAGSLDYVSGLRGEPVPASLQPSLSFQLMTKYLVMKKSETISMKDMSV